MQPSRPKVGRRAGKDYNAWPVFSFIVVCLLLLVSSDRRGPSLVFANDPQSAPHFRRPQLVAFRRGRSIKDMVVRAALFRKVTAPGCFHCHSTSCPLHNPNWDFTDQFLYSGDSVYSFHFRKTFFIRGSFSCKSRHSVYVISCLRCQLQGVGECKDPVSRIQDYIRAAEQELLPENQSRCAIESHFQDADHGPKDLCVQIVDGVPLYGHRLAGVRAVRVRLENIWIKRLIGGRDNGLNVKCQWHRSMVGGSAFHPRVTL